eukprot:1304310-Amphidinium_carterae.1
MCSVVAVDSDDSACVESMPADESRPGVGVAVGEDQSGDTIHDNAAGASESSGRGVSSTDLETGVSSTEIRTGRHSGRRWKRGVLRAVEPGVPAPPVKPGRPRWKS